MSVKLANALAAASALVAFESLTKRTDPSLATCSMRWGRTAQAPSPLAMSQSWAMPARRSSPLGEVGGGDPLGACRLVAPAGFLLFWGAARGADAVKAD